MRVLGRSLVLALALGVVPMASAAAHECIIANRSDTGNERASNSSRWVTISLTYIYQNTANFGLPPLTSAQVAYAVDLARGMGIPETFTFRSDTLLGGSGAGWAKHGLDTNGKGVDHVFVIYGDQLIGALFDALENA